MNVVVRLYRPGFTLGGSGDSVQARGRFGTYSSSEREPDVIMHASRTLVSALVDDVKS
jgi:hypothetical protein